jgi:hypothetical protein
MGGLANWIALTPFCTSVALPDHVLGRTEPPGSGQLGHQTRASKAEREAPAG